MKKACHVDDFGNGRYVRNFLERAIAQQSVRLLSAQEAPESINKKELFQLTKEDIGMLNEGTKKERVAGTARKELEAMIGLQSVKKVIRKAIASYKLNKLYTEQGLSRENASLHMVFTGKSRNSQDNGCPVICGNHER